LLSSGANPGLSLGHRGRTALHIAAALGLAPSVELLLAHNAFIRAADSDGRTPLFLASNAATARLLIARENQYEDLESEAFKVAELEVMKDTGHFIRDIYGSGRIECSRTRDNNGFNALSYNLWRLDHLLRLCIPSLSATEALGQRAIESVNEGIKRIAGVAEELHNGGCALSSKDVTPLMPTLTRLGFPATTDEEYVVTVLDIMAHYGSLQPVPKLDLWYEMKAEISPGQQHIYYLDLKPYMARDRPLIIGQKEALVFSVYSSRPVALKVGHGNLTVDKWLDLRQSPGIASKLAEDRTPLSVLAVSPDMWFVVVRPTKGVFGTRYTIKATLQPQSKIQQLASKEIRNHDGWTQKLIILVGGLVVACVSWARKCLKNRVVEINY